MESQIFKEIPTVKREELICSDPLECPEIQTCKTAYLFENCRIGTYMECRVNKICEDPGLLKMEVGN
jgi:hypothetical protein|tara:strand:- start:612 stop:812 length:201 start_codon:yes stop_codon:yes gene_type:complete